MTRDYSERVIDEMAKAMVATLSTAMVKPGDDGRAIQILMHAGWRTKDISQRLDVVLPRPDAMRRT